MQYNITFANVNRRVPKVVWSKSEPYINDGGETVHKNVSFMFTEDTPPTNLTEALAFVRKHADVLPTDTIKVNEQTEWNYFADCFRPAYVSVLMFDGNDNLLSDETDAANTLSEGEVVLTDQDDAFYDILSQDDIDYLHELHEQGHEVYVVDDRELANG